MILTFIGWVDCGVSLAPFSLALTRVLPKSFCFSETEARSGNPLFFSGWFDYLAQFFDIQVWGVVYNKFKWARCVSLVGQDLLSV